MCVKQGVEYALSPRDVVPPLYSGRAAKQATSQIDGMPKQDMDETRRDEEVHQEEVELRRRAWPRGSWVFIWRARRVLGRERSGCHPRWFGVWAGQGSSSLDRITNVLGAKTGVRPPAGGAGERTGGATLSGEGVKPGRDSHVRSGREEGGGTLAQTWGAAGGARRR